MSKDFNGFVRRIVGAFAGVLIVAAAIGLGRAQETAPAVNPADALFQEGRASLLAGKFQEAEASFRKLHEMEPVNSRGIMGIADVYAAQKRDDEAIRLLEGEVQKNPARLDYHFGIGALAMHAAKYDLAIAEFQRVLTGTEKGSQTSGELFYRMGECYRLKGDLDFSIAMFRQAKEILPGNLAVLSTLGTALTAMGQNAAATQEYQAAVDANPNNAGALNNLAFSLAEGGGDLDLALAYAHRARQLAPNAPELLDTLGWVYLKKNMTAEAIGSFREAVGKSPASSVYHYHLALALNQKTDHAAAMSELKIALQNHPDKQEEEKIRELIQKTGK